MKKLILILAIGILPILAFSQTYPLDSKNAKHIGLHWFTKPINVMGSSITKDKIDTYDGMAAKRGDTTAYKTFGMYKRDSVYQKPGSYASQYQFKTKATNSNVHKTIKKLGGDVDVIPLVMQVTGASASLNLNDAQILWALCEVVDSVTVNSITYNQAVAGTSTFDAYNGFGIYSISGTTVTKIAETVTSATTFTQTANANITSTFPSSYLLVPGFYYIAILANWSTAGTLPALYSVNTGWLLPKIPLTNGLKISGQTTTQASLPASIQTSSIIESNYCPGVILK